MAILQLLRWYFHPAEIVEAYAVSQRRVLGYTPDLYDAYLTFDTGLLVRAKAEWIRRMDALVECELKITGDQGALIYRKIPAYRDRQGLRIDAPGATTADLGRHLRALGRQGIRGKVVADPTSRSPKVLEFFGEENPGDLERPLGHYFSCIRNGREGPPIQGFGPLPSEHDALRQVQIVAAIVTSAERRRAVKIPSSP